MCPQDPIPVLQAALRALGEQVSRGGLAGSARLFVVGGAAGVLTGLLAPARTTEDVDVTLVEPADAWEEVRGAAERVASDLGLPKTWLNDECRTFAWKLPAGWKGRCSRYETYGPLEVWTLDRRDFIAAKILAEPPRPQDLEDLRSLEPTKEELDFVRRHVASLQAECLDPDSGFYAAHAVLEFLEGEP